MTMTSLPSLNIDQQSWIDHQQIQAIADRDSIEYAEAFNQYYEQQEPASFAEKQTIYEPESLRLHKIVTAAANQYSIDYAEAYDRVCTVYQGGCVPLLDWTKVV